MERVFPRKRYFTFGFDHVHPWTGQRLKDSYIELTEDEIDGARTKILEVFGNQWSFEYGPDRFDSAIARFNLTKINLDGSPVE